VPSSLAHFSRRVAEDRSGGRVRRVARPGRDFAISNLESSRADIKNSSWKNTINAHSLRIGGVDSAGSRYRESVSAVTHML
jgi:hypothetical protein